MPSSEIYSYREEKLLQKDFDTTQIYMAEVMDTRNIYKDGSIMVWVLNSGMATKEKKYWVRAYNCSSCYGTVAYNPKQITPQEEPKSFGWFNPMPFVGNHVFIFYPRINGGNVKPYWFGCPMDSNYNSMIPGYTVDNDFVQKVLEKQGLQDDKLRGHGHSSSQRENISMCYGFTSPLGHQFVIDDGWSIKDKETNESFTKDKDLLSKMNNSNNGQSVSKTLYYDKIDWKNELEDKSDERRYDSGIRLRTRNGTQILISDCGDIYAINGTGTAWTEITPDGYINAWSEKGINVASDGDINLHSKKDINIDCDGVLSLRAKDKISIETPDTHIRTAMARMNTSIICNDIQSRTGNIGTFSSQSAQIVGTFKGTLDGTATYATSAAKQPKKVQKPDIVYPKTYDTEVTETNYPDNGEIESICSHVPTHEPWVGHDYNDNIKTPNEK